MEREGKLAENGGSRAAKRSHDSATRNIGTSREEVDALLAGHCRQAVTLLVVFAAVCGPGCGVSSWAKCGKWHSQGIDVEASDALLAVAFDGYELKSVAVGENGLIVDGERELSSTPRQPGAPKSRLSMTASTRSASRSPRTK